MDIGALGGTGTFQFTTTDIAALANGFVSITFGHDVGSTNAARIATATFLDPVSVHAGSILVNGSLNAQASLLLHAVSGDIEVSSAQALVSNDQVDSVWESSLMTLLADQGNILLTNGGSLRILNDDDSDPSQGSTIVLTATNGSILNAVGSFGFVTARDLSATAAADIVLLTDVETLTTDSSVAGDIQIDEQDGLHVLSATTANGSVALTTGGDTEVDLIESETDTTGNDISVQVFNGDLLVTEVIGGTLGNVTLETEGALSGFTPQATAHVTANLLTILAANGIGSTSVPLLILANELSAANTTDAAIVVRQMSGRASLAADIDQDGTGHVSLTVLGGDTVIGAAGIHSEASAGIRIDAAEDLTFNGDVIGSGGPLTLLAGGAAELSAGVSLDSGGGDVFLSAVNGLTQAADASIASSGGDIVINVTGDIVLGLVDARNDASPADQNTWGNVAVTATGFIRDNPASALLNVRAKNLRLAADTGIGQLDGVNELGLEIDALLLAALNTTSGAIAVKDINALQTGDVPAITPDLLLENGTTTPGSTVAALSAVVNNGGGDIVLSAVGDLSVSSTTDAVFSNGAGTVALLGAVINVTGAVRSLGGNLSLVGTGTISLATPGSLLTSGTATIAVSSTGGDLLAAATSEFRTGSGTILLSVSGSITLGLLETTGAVGLRATTGSITAATGGTNTRTVVTGNTLAIVAETGVNGPAASGEAFRTSVNTLSLTGGSGAEFQIHNDGTLTIDTTSALVDTYNTLLAAAALSIAAQSNVDVSGSGNIGIVFDAGDGIVAAGRRIRTHGAGNIVLTADGAFSMGTAAQLSTVNGDISVDAQNNVTIASATSTDGDISITSATGSISDSDPAEAAVDFSTTGLLTLSAATGVGINAGDRQTFDVLLGTLAAETETGGIFVRSTASFAIASLATTVGTTPISVTSGGNLVLNGDVTSTGDVVLLATGNLTQLAGAKLESSTDIRLSSGGILTLDEVLTPGDVALTAVSVLGYAGTDPAISANGLFLDTVGAVGTPAAPLRLAIARLAGTVTGGTLAFNNSGNLTLGLVSVETTPTTPMGALPGLTNIQIGDRLAVNGIGQGVFAVIAGSLTANAGTGAVFSVAQSNPVLWQTSSSQTWNDNFTLGGASLTLRSGLNLSLNGAASFSTGGGSAHIVVAEDFDLNLTSTLALGAGSLILDVGDSMLLNGGITSGASVALLAGREIYLSSIGGPTRVVAQNLIVRAGHRVAAGLLSLTTQVSTLSASAGAGGLYITNTGNLQIGNLGFAVPSLLPGAVIHTAFSGHQGGVTTTQAGAILVNTTGTMTVQEVAAVIEVFPDTLNAISIVADQTGPDGNNLSIVFDIKTTGPDGNPPTTSFSELDGLLTVTVRDGVSTLQQILDAINANVNFPATAVLAGGPANGSQIFSLAPGLDFAFDAAGGRREGALAQVSGTFSGGAEPISAITQIVLPGESYTVLLTALNPGDAANAFIVRVLDDGPGGLLTDATDEASVVWDDINGVLNLYVNFGFTRVGTLIEAVTNAAVPFSAAMNGSFVPGDLNDILGAPPVFLQSNLAPTAILRPTGTNNDIAVTATTGGSLYNGVSFVFVDDGSVATLGVRASFNDITNVMTVFINSNSTTANQVIAALNTQGDFSAALAQELGGGTNTGNGGIQATRFVLRDGAVGVKAAVTLAMNGADNDLRIEAIDFGSDQNGIQVILVRDAAQPVGQAAATWNAGTRVLEVRLNPDFATAGNVLSAINAVVSAPLTASLVAGNSGFGGIQLANYPLTAGGTDGPARADFPVVGSNNDFELVAIAESPSYENIQAFLIDDGSITDGSATVQYFAGTKRLILNVQSGVTTLNTLLAILNADLSVPVNGNLLPGNNGTGVFNVPAQPFLGGVDPVHALASTLLPSGNEIILEATNGGIAPNGIQVVYAIDATLAPNTAAATLFVVDDVRLLQIRVQSTSTTFNAIQTALTSAGLPFTVQNTGTQTVGAIAQRSSGIQEGTVRLLAGGNISLVGRVQSETGAVNISTSGTGSLTFNSETSRIVAISAADISLAGSFANIASLESPLVKVYGNGFLRIVTGSQALASLEPVLLQSGGDITLGGSGLALDNENLDVLAGGTITVSGPVNAGTGDILLDAGAAISITGTGSLSGGDLTVSAETGVTQNGNLTATGDGAISVSTTAGNILMGAAAVTQSDTGAISYDAPGNIGITLITSTSGNIDITAGGAILDTHASNGLNLSTAGVTTLTAQTGIGAILTGDIKTAVGQLQLRNLGATGDIVITETAAGGNLDITELTQDAASGWSIVTVENGNLTFSGPVTHSGNGNLLVSVNGALLTEDDISLNGGIVTLAATGNVTLQDNVSSGGGDVSVVSGGILSMDPLMTLDADGGNVLLQAAGNVLLAQVLSPDADVRIESTAAAILRAANDGRTNVIAGILQLRAALSVATLASEAAALLTDVTRLTATATNGVFALRELNNLIVGASTVSLNFAQIDRTLTPGSWNETQLLTDNGAAVLRVVGSLTVETIALNPTVAIDGNFRLSAGSILTLEGDLDVTNGSAHILSTGNMTVNGDLDVSGGTLLMESSALFTQGAASVIAVVNADTILSSTGAMSIARVETGTGDLALTSGGDILRTASAPAVQLVSATLRLQSAGAIGVVGTPIALTTATISALAANGIHLDATGNLAVNSVTVVANTLSTLAVAGTPRSEAALADLQSSAGSNILLRVSGSLELRDGDADGVSVTTNAGGHVVIEAASLNAYADVSTVEGNISLNITGAARWWNTDSIADLLTQDGDIHVVSGAAIVMDNQTRFVTASGKIRVATAGNFSIASVQAPNGLVALDVGGALTDNGDTDTDIVADTLQILAASGIGALAPYNAIDINVNRLAARTTTGPFALSELGAADVGEVSGSVAFVGYDAVVGSTPVAALFGVANLGGGHLSLSAAGNLTFLSSGDARHAAQSTGAGNIVLQTTGLAAVLTINDSVLAGTGHITLRSTGNLLLGDDVPVTTSGGGSVTLLSSAGAITQNAGGTLTAANGDVVLNAFGAIAVAGIVTNTNVALTAGGAILDNEALRTNVIAAALRLNAGLNIATGTNALDVEVGSLSARTLNGAMFITEVNDLLIASTSASTSVVAVDGTVTVTPVAAQTGLVSGGVAGTIVVTTPDGELQVSAGNAVSASQAGNILLSAFDYLILDSAVTSGSGSITLETQANFSLAATLLVSTGGAGEIHVLAAGTITTGADSRFVANNGNVALAAGGNILLGGISTLGRAAIGSLNGFIRGAGSTTFNQEVVAAQLLLSAPNAGVGTLSPADPVLTFRTRVGRVAGLAGAAGLNLVNEITVSVDLVTVTLQRVTAAGSLLALPTVNLTDLTTSSGNGSIVLRATGGSVTLSDGGDLNGNAVVAHGSGNIRIFASASVSANADVRSGTGHITLRAATNLDVGAGADVVTGTPGTVYLRAESGTATMTGTSTATANGSSLLLQASGNIVLGNLTAASIGVKSTNGSVTRAAGSTLNLSGSLLRLESSTDIGSSSAPLTTGAATLSARSSGGGIYLLENDNVAIGSVGVTVQEVLNDASTTPVTEGAQSGLATTANNGNIVLVSTAGSIAVNGAVSAHGSGNILLQANTTQAVDANISSGTGNISVIGGSGLSFSAGRSVTTASPGSVLLDGGSGTLVMTATTAVNAPGGSVRLAADGDISVGVITATNASILSADGAILNNAGTSTNISASTLRLNAEGSIGTPATPLRTSVDTLSAFSETGSIALSESNGVTVGAVAVTTPRVLSTGLTENVVDAAQSDLETGLNGNIILVTLAGSVTLADGDEDFSSVTANGSGSVRIEAAANLNVNAGVFSGTGHLTLRAGVNLGVAVGVVQIVTASPGTISLFAGTGALTMTGLTQVTAAGSSLRVRGAGDVTLGNLTAANVSVISTTNSIVNAAGTTRNVTATTLRLEAQIAIGTAVRRLSTAVTTVSALARTGSIFITELDAVTVGSVTVSVTEFTALAGTTVVTDAAQANLDTLGIGDIVLVAGGTITLGTVNGATVNLISGGAILNAVGTPLNVTSAALLLRAQNDIGETTRLLTVNAGTLSAHSTVGNIYIAEQDSVIVGSVLDLSTSAIPDDVQTGVRALASEDVVLSAVANLTLGLVTGDTVTLVTGGAVLVTLGSTLNVDSTNLRIQSGTGIGEIGRYLNTRVAVLAAASANGDILISEANAVTIGAVATTVPALLPATLTGLTTTVSGDIVLLANGAITVSEAVVSVENIRLSATGNLILGNVTGVDVSLISSAVISHPAGLVSAANLRVRATGNITINTAAGNLSAISSSGSLTLTEADNATLASVSVTAGGVTDAAQHGLSAPLGITATSLAGRFLDGGDAEADVRSAGPVVLQTAGGLGSTGAGALEVDTPTFSLNTLGAGTVYLNLVTPSTITGLTLGGTGNLYLNAAVLTISGPVILPNGSAYLTVVGDLDISNDIGVSKDLRILAANLTLAATTDIVSATGNIQLGTPGRLDMAAGSRVEATLRNVRIDADAGMTVARVIAGTSADLRSAADISAVSADRATHELVAPALRLDIGADVITPLLTDAGRLDVQTLGSLVVTEANNLLVGRYGLRILNAAANDTLQLNLGTATLGSVTGNGVVDNAGTLLVQSSANVTLDTRLSNAEGDIRINSANLAVAVAGTTPMLDAVNGRVTLVSSGAISGNTLLVRADEITAQAQTGDLNLTLTQGSRVVADGISLAGGAGNINLNVQTGDLELQGRVQQLGTGNSNITVTLGKLHVRGDLIANPTTQAIVRAGNQINLALDTGMTFAGLTRMLMIANSHAATTRTGNLFLQLQTSAVSNQVFLRNFLVNEGTGQLNLLGASGQNLVLLETFSIRNLATTGGLTLTSSGFISMAIGTLIRNNNGAMVLEARDFEIAQIISLGDSTRLTITTTGAGLGFRPKDGSPTGFVQADHNVVFQIYSGQRVRNIQLQGGATATVQNLSTSGSSSIGANLLINVNF
jgi:hypothetical protein